jgi:hypothetical protein
MARIHCEFRKAFSRLQYEPSRYLVPAPQLGGEGPAASVRPALRLGMTAVTGGRAACLAGRYPATFNMLAA